MMSFKKTDLSTYNNSWYNPGANGIKRVIWYFVNAAFFNTSLFPVNTFKRSLLRLFGAQIEANVVIKPRVNIKSPWFLRIGKNSWLGEDVWIDNLVMVHIGDNCCISQGAMLLTGNHDYTKESFDLIVKEINIESGVWIGAKATVCPGVTCYSHSVLSVGAVASKNLEAYSIYSGIPAVKVKAREIGA